MSEDGASKGSFRWEEGEKRCGSIDKVRKIHAAFGENWGSNGTGGNGYRTVGSQQKPSNALMAYVRENLEDPPGVSRSLVAKTRVASNRCKERCGGRSIPPPDEECCWRPDCCEAGLFGHILVG